MPTKWKDADFRATAKAATTKPLTYFRPDVAEVNDQMRRFMEGEIRNPTFTYVNLQDVDFGRMLQALDAYEPTDSVLEVLRGDLLVRRRNAIDLAQAAQAGDMDRFRLANRAVGFVPEEDLFQSILSSLRGRIEAFHSALGTELEALLPPSDGRSCLPSLDVFAYAHDAVMAVCEQMRLPTDLKLEGEWVADDMASMLRQAFADAGVNDWTVEITSKQTRISTSSTKKIYIPADRKVKARKAFATMAHELIHAWRWIMGERTGQYLLFTGTAAVPWAEEGVTTVVEQVLLGADYPGNQDRHAREDYYLAISLAEGLIDGERRDFRDVYTIMVAYYRFAEAELPVEFRSSETPEERAWIQTNRTFRGSDCQTPGVYWGKDTTYAASNLRIWDAVSSNLSLTQYFIAGKFNPADTTDVATLVAAGLIPDLS